MNFDIDVIEKSRSTPLVVDFWASWCGPCKVLTPVLEELDQEDDRWELVKINTEEHPELARAYHVMSIPNVKMFHEGEVIAEFAGALPRAYIQKWLDENIPSRERSEWGRLTEGAGSWPDGDFAARAGEFLARYPDFEEAYLLYAKHLVLQDSPKALQILDTHSLRQYSQETVEDIRAIAEFLNSDFENGSPVITDKLRQAREALTRGGISEAVRLMTDAVSVDKSYSDNLPIKHGVAMFRLLGNDHPVTKNYRKLFDMAIY